MLALRGSNLCYKEDRWPARPGFLGIAVPREYIPEHIFLKAKQNKAKLQFPWDDFPSIPKAKQSKAKQS